MKRKEKRLESSYWLRGILSDCKKEKSAETKGKNKIKGNYKRVGKEGKTGELVV